MLDTDENPYAYLPESWAGSTKTAEGFSSLIHYIHHALYDDGDITFVTVEGQPRIVFSWRNSEKFREDVLGSIEKEFEERSGIKYDIQVLDISPEKFGELYDSWQKEYVRKCFLRDSVRGIDWAAEHYREYKCWDDSWISLAEENVK